MKRKELLARLCDLTTEVGSRVFSNELSYDCFCKYRQKEKGTCYTFSFNEGVLRYIEQAVHEKMEWDLAIT